MDIWKTQVIKASSMQILEILIIVLIEPLILMFQHQLQILIYIDRK